MQFLNIHHLLYRTVRYLLPVMLLQVNLACLSFHFAPYEENVWSYEWPTILHILYIVYLLLVLLWLVLTCLCIAAMNMIGIYINLLFLLWTLPTSFYEIKNMHFGSRYRAKSTNTIGSTSCYGVPLRVCFGHLMTNIRLCGRCIVTPFVVRTGFSDKFPSIYDIWCTHVDGNLWRDIVLILPQCSVLITVT
jgi:hypothetical protein